MNDSFLEDLELVSNSPNAGITIRQTDRHVTTRKTSSPVPNLSKVDATKHVAGRPKAAEVVVLENEPASRKETDRKKEGLKPASKTKPLMKPDKNVESKSKGLESKKDGEARDDVLMKAREGTVKVTENKVVSKDRNRRSGSQKQAIPDSSSKENSQPSDSSKDSSLHNEALKEKQRFSDGSQKKSDSKELYSVALLKSIKELVSTYTKQETTRILRAMQELHMNSQSNLIKHLLLQTDDLIKEMHPTVDSARMKCIIEENRRLNEEVVLLQIRNEELQKQLQDFEFVKQENVALKLKCQELSKH